MFCIAIGSWTLGTSQGGKLKWMVELGHVESFRNTFWNRVARPLDTFSEIAAAATPVLTLLKSSEFRRRVFGQDRKRFTSMCEQVHFLVSKFKTRWILEVEHVLCTSSLFASIFFCIYSYLARLPALPLFFSICMIYIPRQQVGASFP